MPMTTIRMADDRYARFGDIAVLCFLVVQGLDGALTYLGVTAWGLSIEGNPLISTAMHHAGWATGLAAAKLIAVGFGIILHLQRVHHLVAILTVFYVGAAIVPWTALFLTH
jgi:hypothetical protein